MISDFWNHVAIVVFFSICGVAWAGFNIYLWRIPYENKVWDRLDRTYMLILIGPPLAAYLIISKVW